MNHVLFISAEELAELRELVAREVFETRLNRERTTRLHLPNPGFFEQRVHRLKNLLDEIEQANADLEAA
jgi:hypothetical protein